MTRSKLILATAIFVLVFAGAALGSTLGRTIHVRQGDWVITPPAIGYQCSVDNVAGLYCLGPKKSDYTAVVFKKGIVILNSKAKPVVICRNGGRCPEH